MDQIARLADSPRRQEIDERAVGAERQTFRVVTSSNLDIITGVEALVLALEQSRQLQHNG